MNIFATHSNPKFAAREHCYVHVVKMIVEYHQLMSTAHRVLDGNEYADKRGFCALTHANHPSAVWTRDSAKHYRWLWLCAKELHAIYEGWSEKRHKYFSMHQSLAQSPVNIGTEPFRMPDRAMPTHFKHGTVQDSYQHYLNHKFREWKARPKPVKVVFPCGEPKWYAE